MIRVLIADDHKLVRASLGALLARVKDIEVVGEARDGNQAVELAEKLEPDIVLMDMAMPGLNGLRAVERIRAHSSSTQVIMISMYSDEALVRGALSKGVRGYVLKQSSYTDLVQAVHAVFEGKTFFSQDISDQLPPQ